MRKIFFLLILSLTFFSSVCHADMSPNSSRNFTDVFSAYRIVDTDERLASPRFYGFLRLDGWWFIMKATATTNVTTYTFIKGTSDYQTNWTNRASLTYATFDNVFNTGI